MLFTAANCLYSVATACDGIPECDDFVTEECFCDYIPEFCFYMEQSHDRESYGTLYGKDSLRR